MTDENVSPAPEEAAAAEAAQAAEPAAAAPAEPAATPEPADQTPIAPEAFEAPMPEAPETAAPPVPAPPAPAPEPPAPPAAQPQYAPPPPPQPPYAAAAPVSPATASDKSKVVAGVLGILLGSLGIHKFYLGYNKEGIIMLAVSLISFGFLAWIMSIIGLIEGILYLVKTDEEFAATYVTGRKGWF